MNGADVRSIGVLREWLAALGDYRGEIGESLGSARMEIRRGEEWLQTQLSLWQKAVKEREEDVHQKKMELSAKKVPGPTGREPDTTLEERALRRAKARLENAQEKVQLCRSWIGRIGKVIDEVFAAPAHRLDAFLDGDFTRGTAVIARRAEALERYAELGSGPKGGSS